MQGVQGYLSRASQKGPVQVLCFILCKKNLKSNYKVITDSRVWGFLWSCSISSDGQLVLPSRILQPASDRYLLAQVRQQCPASNYNNYLNEKAIFDSVISTNCCADGCGHCGQLPCTPRARCGGRWRAQPVPAPRQAFAQLSGLASATAAVVAALPAPSDLPAPQGLLTTLLAARRNCMAEERRRSLALPPVLS